jgi:hypothetical protein
MKRFLVKHFDSKRMLANLAKTCELIDLTYRLKEAHFLSRNPASSRHDALVALSSRMVQRKDRQWTLHKD